MNHWTTDSLNGSQTHWIINSPTDSPNPLIHHSLNHWLIESLIQQITPHLNHWFMKYLLYLITKALIHSLTKSLTHSIICSSNHSIVYWITLTLTKSLPHSRTHWITLSLTQFSLPLGQIRPSGCPALWSSVPAPPCCSAPGSSPLRYASLPASAALPPPQAPADEIISSVVTSQLRLMNKQLIFEHFRPLTFY